MSVENSPQNCGNVKRSCLSLLFGQTAHKEKAFIEVKLMCPPLTYKHDALHVNLCFVVLFSVISGAFAPVCFEILDVLPLIGDSEDPSR